MNIEVKEGGEASIILCSQTPDPVAELGRSEVIRGDHANYIVRWPIWIGPPKLNTSWLRFHLRKAKLYSFWFE